ncbi:MAG: AbgT family transporter [Alphaproteobacteria bacterium]|nr:AbgT family transporter [Alphaproteobacteria bacterium]
MKAFDRTLDWIERAGNRLPDPVTLFVFLIVAVVVASVAAAAFGLSAVHPVSGEAIAAKSVLAGDLVQRLLTEMPKTFAGFPPLGYVLLAMLGVGVAEKSGFLVVALRALVSGVPRYLLTAAVVFAGVMSSLAVDAGYVVLIPLGAAIFLGAGRHPIAGLAAAFAGVSGGFSANLVLTPLDALLAGLTEAAAKLVHADATFAVSANYFLMVAFVPVFVAVGTWVTEVLVEPRLKPVAATATQDAAIASLTPAERRGLLVAGLVLLLFAGLVVALCLGPDAALRDAQGTLDPLVHSLVALMFLAFLGMGLGYGITTGTVRSDRDAVGMMGGAMADLASYIVLAFFAAHFLALFSWSNLGIITAIGGARSIEATGLSGTALLLALIVLTMSVNILIGSASAKWSFFAPIFVPMLMLVGIDPAATQAAYRVGDSATNMVTPLLPYFPLILIVGRRYDPSFGIGSLVATMLPYSLFFTLSTSFLFLVWYWLGIPFGPGG